VCVGVEAHRSATGEIVAGDETKVEGAVKSSEGAMSAIEGDGAITCIGGRCTDSDADAPEAAPAATSAQARGGVAPAADEEREADLESAAPEERSSAVSEALVDSSDNEVTFLGSKGIAEGLNCALVDAAGILAKIRSLAC
jgi:hypothetical protein